MAGIREARHAKLKFNSS
jgi:hypothetical protein